jgi:hypothetical protein
MPQLQIKVPTLRRWGKKVAVIIDEGFYASIGVMRQVGDVSNCDVAWFVVGFEESSTGAGLVARHVHLATLEDSVEGLTAGAPASLGTFEARILRRLASKTQPR